MKRLLDLKWSVLGAWSFCLIAIVVANLNNGYNFRFNADEMYFPSLYVDLFTKGYGLYDWTLQPAPSYFPSMFGYFLVEALVQNHVVSLFLMAFLQIIAAFAIFDLFTRELWPEHRESLRVALPIVCGVGILAVAEDIFYIPIFASGTHFSTICICLWVGYLSLRFLVLEKFSWAYLVSLFVLTVAGTVSDGIFSLSLTLPMLCAIVAGFVLTSLSRQRLLVLGGAMLAAMVGSRIIVQFLGSLNSGLKIDLSLANVYECWPKFLNVMGEMLTVKHILFTVVFAVCLAVVVAGVSLGILRWRKGSVHRQLQLFFGVFYLAGLGGTLVASLATGTFIDMATFGRHFIVPLLLPFMVLPVVLVQGGEWITRSRALTLTGVGAIGLFCLYGAVRWPYDHTKTFFSHYPESAACVDRYADEYQLTRGISDYWNAKTTTTLSKKGVRVLQVGPTLIPYLYINNVSEYDRDRRPFNFALTRDLKEDILLETYGEPKAILHCGTQSLWVYGEDSLFQKTFWKFMAYSRHLGDVNGDGNDDIIVANNQTVDVSLYKDGEFAPSETWYTGQYRGTRDEVIGDINGDGRDDFLVLNRDLVAVKLSEGDTFGTTQIWYRGPIPGQVSSGLMDVNQDGRRDLVIFDDQRYFTLISQGGHLSLGPSGQIPPGLGGGNRSPQLFVGSFGGIHEKMMILMGKTLYETRWEDGRLAGVEASLALPMGVPLSSLLRSGDLNHDGLQDIVILGSRIIVYLGTSRGFEVKPLGKSLPAMQPYLIDLGNYRDDTTMGVVNLNQQTFIF